MAVPDSSTILLIIVPKIRDKCTDYWGYALLISERTIPINASEQLFNSCSDKYAILRRIAEELYVNFVSNLHNHHL